MLSRIEIAKHALRYSLTKELGLSRPYVSELLSGKRNPKYADAIRIETELRIPASAWTRKGEAVEHMWLRITERYGNGKA